MHGRPCGACMAAAPGSCQSVNQGVGHGDVDMLSSRIPFRPASDLQAHGFGKVRSQLECSCVCNSTHVPSVFFLLGKRTAVQARVPNATRSCVQPG